MKKFLFYTLAFSISFTLKSIPSDLQKSNIILFKGSVYYFGFLEEGKNLSFRCFRYSTELAPLDSFSLSIGPAKAENYHEIGVDTLHSFLNFWFQQKAHTAKAKYLRLNNRLRQVFYNEDAELTRINTQFIYDDDVIWHRNKVYVIRSPTDSAQKFFLSCYELKSDKSFFDYEVKWGFRFYKFNYLRCKLLMADDEKVMIYVHALDGERKGQYILSISALTGELLTEAKFNDDEEKVQLSYFYSAHTYNEKTKEFFAGGIVTKKGEEAGLLLPKKSPVLFMMVLDEKGEIRYRLNDVAVLPPGVLKTKDLKFLTVRIKKIEVSENGLVQVTSEVAGSTDGKRFRPYGFWVVDFTYAAGSKELISNNYYDLMGNPANKLITKANGDINGSFSIKNATENDKTLYMQHQHEVVVGSKTEKNTLKMLVVRKDIPAKKITYSELTFKDGKMELKSLFNTSPAEMPVCFPLNNSSAIIFAKSEKEGLIFRRIEW